jgi:hydroxymethylpyrimidine pyrophosphatase-like HAD family hydrolase
MVSPRIAFLDVDGTIIDSGVAIAPSTIDAVRTARRNGHLVYLSTGRTIAEIYPAILVIGFDGAITAGGGFATVGDELVITRTMPEEAAMRMVGVFEESGYDFYLQCYDEVYPSPGMYASFTRYLADDRERTGTTGLRLASVGAEAGIGAEQALADTSVDAVDAADAADEDPILRAFADVRPLRFTGVAKSMFLADDPRAFDRVSAALSGDFHVITGTIPHLGRGSGEVTFGGVDKGSTISQLLDRLGRDAASAIGIGDSSNDIEMLRVCGVGIAMGNATDAVKAEADEVTTSVLDDGIWNAFRRHGLI